MGREMVLKQLAKDKPSVYAKEIQNDPTTGLLSRFTRDDFRRWKLENGNAVLYDKDNYTIISKFDIRDCRAAIACDLAWETKKENDFSVILPALLTPSSDILIEKYVRIKGMKPNDLEEILFTMEERLRLMTGDSVPIGFEKAMLEKVMQWMLKSAMRTRNQFLLFKDLMWDKDKITRIVTRLQPRYAQHTIYHLPGQGDLENELVRIPYGVNDDICDCVSGVCQLLQYPKSIGKPVLGEDEFMRLRRITIESRKSIRKKDKR
jgi:hypothetical protein